MVRNIATLLLLVLFVACGTDSDTKTDSEDIVSPPRALVVENRGLQDVPPAGLRVTFRVLADTGFPVRPLVDSDVVVINNEKGEPFGAGLEGGGASAPTPPSNYGLFSVLALDMSDSIVLNGAQNDVIDGAKQYVNTTVRDVPEELVQKVAIMVFGKTVATRVVQDFTNDPELLDEVLEGLRGSPGLGGTNLYGAYDLALAEVGKQGAGAELVERFVVLLTDGEHEAGDEENMRARALAAKAAAEAEQTTFFTIGIKGNYNEDRVRELASKSQYFVLAENAGDLSETFLGIAEYVRDISSSNYVVGVCTPVEFGSPSLNIKVTVDGATGSLTVYYSPGNGGVDSCDPELIARPCENRNCGSSAIPGIHCGYCSTGFECLNGTCVSVTWQDMTTGLVWQQSSPAKTENLADAKSYCQNLDLDGGGWRLPSVGELRSLILGCPATQTSGACGVTDSCLSFSSCRDDVSCGPCSVGSGPSNGCYWTNSLTGSCSEYWSSSLVSGTSAYAWIIDFHSGSIDRAPVVTGKRVRCVR